MNQLAILKHIPAKVLYERYRAGDRGQALVRPQVPSVRSVTVHGKQYTLPELAHAYGLAISTVARNYRAGARGNGLVRSAYRKARHIEVDGKRYTFSELQGITGINTSTLRMRYQKGLRGKDLLNDYHLKYHVSGHGPMRIQIGDHRYTIRELSRKYGIGESTIRRRYLKGERGQDLFRMTQVHPTIQVKLDDGSYTLQELSDMYHVKISSLRYRYHQGKRGYDLIHAAKKGNDGYRK